MDWTLRVLSEGGRPAIIVVFIERLIMRDKNVNAENQNPFFLRSSCFLEYLRMSENYSENLAKSDGKTNPESVKYC